MDLGFDLDLGKHTFRPFDYLERHFKLNLGAVISLIFVACIPTIPLRIIMDIRTFELPPIGTNAFLVANPDNKRALLVDAPASALETIEPILEKENCTLEALLLTHGHYDHMIDTHAFNKAGIPVYAHAADREWIENPMIQAMFMPGILIEPATVDVWVNGFDVLDLIGYTIEVRHVPGHAPGNVLFYFPASKCAFVGDAIFAGGVGRPDLPGGDWDTLKASILGQIFTLPDDTVLYPGHGPATSVGHEKATNPYLQREGKVC